MKYLILLIVAPLAFSQRPWPLPPQNQVHPLGNSWGIYQDYGTGPYVHNGDDILTTALCPTMAIKYGYVKAIWNSGTLYRGISIADSAGAAFCSGYQYYHMDQIQVQVGDTVYLGDTIAYVVTWPVANFHHDHFSKNRNSGVQWSSYGGYYKNPLTEFTPDNDSMVPLFSNAVTGRRFAVCINNTSTYLNPDSIFGTVDFICRVEDKINHRTWWCAPYKLMFSIRDTFFNYVVPLMLGVQMSESLDSYNPPQVRTVYKDDATCNSNCDYDSLARRLYFIFTNTDGDSVIEATDSLAGWNTLSVPDGYYWVRVNASDEYGNTVPDSMRVRVRNLVGVEEAQTQRRFFLDENDFTVTPNPAREVVNLAMNAAGFGVIELNIYDVAGRRVWTMNTTPGPHSIIWDRRDSAGNPVPGGIYYVELRTYNEVKRKKLILLN